MPSPALPQTAPFRPVTLASLRAAEAFYDGPFDPESLIDDQDINMFLSAAAARGRSGAKAGFRQAARFVRQHHAQARPDLVAIMLREAAAHRSSFRYWHRRFVALRNAETANLGEASDAL
jgi:hypothetical protein